MYPQADSAAMLRWLRSMRARLAPILWQIFPAECNRAALQASNPVETGTIRDFFLNNRWGGLP
jgi:hypothetical protein